MVLVGIYKNNIYKHILTCHNLYCISQANLYLYHIIITCSNDKKSKPQEYGLQKKNEFGM